MKTLYFISLNSCFASTHIVIRFTHDYGDFVADKDYAIFMQIQGLFKRQHLKMCSLHCTCPGTGGSLTSLKPTRKHLELSTDNKKLIYYYKTLAFHSKDPRNQVIGVLKAGSTVNDIAHHLGCFRQTI